jgi:pentatricopeptide repeat protein
MARNAEGVLPNVRTYSALASVYGKCGRLDDAFALLPRMEAAGIKPDRVRADSLHF